MSYESRPKLMRTSSNSNTKGIQQSSKVLESSLVSASHKISFDRFTIRGSSEIRGSTTVREGAGIKQYLGNDFNARLGGSSSLPKSPPNSSNRASKRSSNRSLDLSKTDQGRRNVSQNSFYCRLKVVQELCKRRPQDVI